MLPASLQPGLTGLQVYLQNAFFTTVHGHKSTKREHGGHILPLTDSVKLAQDGSWTGWSCRTGCKRGSGKHSLRDPSQDHPGLSCACSHLLGPHYLHDQGLGLRRHHRCGTPAASNAQGHAVQLLISFTADL